MESKSKTYGILFILALLISILYILLITLLPPNDNCYSHDFCFCELPIQGTTIQPQLFSSAFAYLIAAFFCLVTFSTTANPWMSCLFILNLFCLFFSTVSIHVKLEQWSVEVFRIFLILMMSNCIALLIPRIHLNKVSILALIITTILLICIEFFVKELFRPVVVIQFIFTCLLIGFAEWTKIRFLIIWLLFAPFGFLFLWVQCSQEDILHTRGIGNCFLAFSFLSLYNFV